jgi:O-antigen ligase
MGFMRGLEIRRLAYAKYLKPGEQVALWPLALLLVSFFYCLPLGRYSIGRFDTDFRVFDFAILLVYGYYATDSSVSCVATGLLKSDRWFHKWLKFLFLLSLLSLLVSIAYSGSDFLLPRLIRLYRFLAYISVSFLVISVVRNKANYLRFFRLLFWLIAAVGAIAFAQGLGFIGNFWPDYWRVMYSENNAPVATLSPHHKHIGVIMLVGVCLGLAYFLRTRSMFMKAGLVLLILMMFTVPLFSGTRTYLLGFVGVIPAMMVTGRQSMVIPSIIIVTSAYVLLQFSGDTISGRVEQKFEQRVTSRIEKLGYEGLYRERTVIYWDILRALQESPQLLITGTGFQNIFRFISANGAHNNYLQALMELGLLGLYVFLSFLALLWKNLRDTARTADRDISAIAQFTWVALCGLLMTMLVGETFWGQAAMFTLAGQLSFLFGLAVSPLFWMTRYYNQLLRAEITVPGGGERRLLD